MYNHCEIDIFKGFLERSVKRNVKAYRHAARKGLQAWQQITEQIVLHRRDIQLPETICESFGMTWIHSLFPAGTMNDVFHKWVAVNCLCGISLVRLCLCIFLTEMKINPHFMSAQHRYFQIVQKIVSGSCPYKTHFVNLLFYCNYAVIQWLCDTERSKATQNLY